MYPPPVNEIKPPCKIGGISHLTDAIRISMYVLQHVVGCELHTGLSQLIINAISTDIQMSFERLEIALRNPRTDTQWSYCNIIILLCIVQQCKHVPIPFY